MCGLLQGCTMKGNDELYFRASSTNRLPASPDSRQNIGLDLREGGLFRKTIFSQPPGTCENPSTTSSDIYIPYAVHSRSISHSKYPHRVLCRKRRGHPGSQAAQHAPMHATGLSRHKDPISRGTADAAQQQCTCGSIALTCNDVSTRVIEAGIFHHALEHSLLLEKKPPSAVDATNGPASVTAALGAAFLCSGVPLCGYLVAWICVAGPDPFPSPLPFSFLRVPTGIEPLMHEWADSSVCSGSTAKEFVTCDLGKWQEPQFTLPPLVLKTGPLNSCGTRIARDKITFC